MSSRETSGIEEESSTENIYLSKILLFTPKAEELAETLKSQNDSAVSVNCLRTIGMFPIVSRVDTPLGKLCMSIWLISTNERFTQFRMAYYSGASHSIILCKNENDINSLRDLYQAVPQGVPLTIVNASQNEINNEVFDINEAIEEQIPNNISTKIINSIDELNAVFTDIGLKITQDIISGEYQTFSPQLLKPSNVFKLYNKRSVEKIQDLIGRLGYSLDDNGIVSVSKNEFIFDIDFYRNQIKATIISCVNCERNCRHFRRLCVVEKDQGYSNSLHIDNLRALAILYSLHDGDLRNYQVEIQEKMSKINYIVLEVYMKLIVLISRKMNNF